MMMCTLFCSCFHVVAFLRGTCQTVCAHTLLRAEFALTKAAVSVNPLCLFSHTGYLLCSRLPSRSVHPKRALPPLPPINQSIITLGAPDGGQLFHSQRAANGLILARSLQKGVADYFADKKQISQIYRRRLEPFVEN